MTPPLTTLLAHPGQAPAPHDAWSAWNADIPLIVVFLVTAWAYRRGRTPGLGRAVDVRRARCFVGAMAALALALLSPLDAISHALASAHMAQHLILMLVAAPLLALSAPSTTLMRGSPLALRRSVTAVRRRFRKTAARVVVVVRHPIAVWLLHVGALWLWHAAVFYEAALQHPLVHAAEHATFLFTGVLLWRITIGPRGTHRVSPGLGVMLLFTLALQGVFLSLLLTFARTSWYGVYAQTTSAWGLEPLADQQLAGVMMWSVGGVAYLAAALTLLVMWIRSTEGDLGALDERGGRHSGA